MKPVKSIQDSIQDSTELTSGVYTYSIPTDSTNTDVSTADTIKVIKELCQQYKDSVCINQAVNDATVKLSNNASDREIVRAVYYWVKSRIHFLTDEENETRIFQNPLHPFGSEILVCPDVLLKTGYGDCDDFTLLLDSMLSNLGFVTKLVTIAADHSDPNKFSHIFMKAFLLDELCWIYLDASHGPLPGWRTKDHYRIKEW